MNPQGKTQMERKFLIPVFLMVIQFILFSLTAFGLDSGKIVQNRQGGTDPWTDARKSMVLYQIRDRGIQDDQVLKAMEKVARHEFVPESHQARSYADRPLPIGFGQTISQPYIVALMTELLGVNEGSRVLEVGTGSGYQAAVLAEIADQVYTIEIVKPLYDRSRHLLESLGYDNIHSLHGDGYFGWPGPGPYDAIIVTCASDFIPPLLLDQLKPGGRMCIPVGPPFKVQHLVLVQKETSGRILTKIITSVRFVPLVRTSLPKEE